MGATRNALRSGVAALVLGAFGFAPVAMALATYDGLAEFELTLSSVTNAAGTPASTGWGVDYDGYVVDEDTIIAGDATGSATATVPGTGSLVADETIVQSAAASGSAANGVVDSFAFTGLDVDIFNTSLEDLTFTFAYTALVEAAVTTDSPSDDSFVSAFIDILDDLGFFDILLYVEADVLFGPLADSDSMSDDMLSFTLASGETNTISASFLDTTGFAEGAAVPAPTTLALFALGIAGLLVRQRS